MAKILDIKYDKEKFPRYKICFYLENSTVAESLSIIYRGLVRQLWIVLELDYKGRILILDGPIADEHGVVICEQQKKVEEVAGILKNVIERYTPGFKKRIGEIILTDPTIDNTNFDFVEILEAELNGKTK